MARTCQQELLLRQALAGLPGSGARRTGSQAAFGRRGRVAAPLGNTYESVRTRKNQLQILRIMDFQSLMGSRSDVPSLDQPKLEGLQRLDTPQPPGPPPRRTAPSVS